MASGGSSSATSDRPTARMPTRGQDDDAVRRRGRTEGQKSPTSLVIALAVQSRYFSISTFVPKNAPNTPFQGKRAPQNARARAIRVPGPATFFYYYPPNPAFRNSLAMLLGEPNDRTVAKLADLNVGILSFAIQGGVCRLVG